ncbi:hypothetical protein EYZ11_004873 [Aspergillus tanneri]|uniref:Uncharacterized protein n=1 Tax=Aspergillus tanneri TaxID=1220188 RepID=A0A4S3JK07_9EURO|nr:hypothetical protein EYZ11_004873 [Aspergillus tanneri]
MVRRKTARSAQLISLLSGPEDGGGCGWVGDGANDKAGRKQGTAFVAVFASSFVEKVEEW